MKVNRQAICDVLNKKALLDWHKERIEHWKQFRKTFKDGSHSLSETCEVRIDTHQVAINLIQSGTFDADESEGTWKATAEVFGRENAQLDSEVQRLRAALEKIKRELYWGNAETAIKRVEKMIDDVLSGTTEPTGAQLADEHGYHKLSKCCGECAYIEQLEEERQKLIEALRWYADEENQKLDESTRYWENVYSPYEMDGGQRARDILKKIGVTVK